MRRSFDLPPFTRIAVLTIRSQHENMAGFATRTLAARLRGMLPPPATMTDPMPAPIPRAHGQFRFQITVKGPSARILSRTLRKLVQEAGLGDDPDRRDRRGRHVIHVSRLAKSGRPH